MSANNYMEIKETKKGWFEVSMRDADTGARYGTSKKTQITCSNLKLAILEAQRRETEYGLRFIFREDKE